MSCSFCFKPESEVEQLFVGPDYVYTDYVAICNECIEKATKEGKGQVGRTTLIYK